jgi:hypothetical protein
VQSEGYAYGGYCGLCPICHKTDGYINVGSSQWFYCAEHKTCWLFGINLFSSFQRQTEKEKRAIYDKLGFETFRQVEPWFVWKSSCSGPENTEIRPEPIIEEQAGEEDA